MTEQPISPTLAAQAAEAADAAPEVPKLRTKSVTWRGRIWQVRQKPGAVFLDRYESGQVMKAAESVLGADQYAALLDLDPDLEGDDGIDGFFNACNRVWGLDKGN